MHRDRPTGDPAGEPRGAARPLVFIPGIQGRWQWLGPAVDALARDWRVLPLSLTDAMPGDCFPQWHRAIDDRLDEAGAARAPVVGISFGGLIAATYAASRPHRVSHLVLVSAPPPDWTLDPQSLRYLRHPALSMGPFALRALARLRPEISAGLTTPGERAWFWTSYLFRTLRWPASPRLMAAWVREWLSQDLAACCRGVTAPTLVVTGDPELDRVVPVPDTLRYLDLIAGARHVALPRTGHIGLILQPDAFARIVTGFIDGA